MAGRAPRAGQMSGFKLRPVLHAMSLLDLQTAWMWPGVRRAALPRQSPAGFLVGAGEGNRTLMTSLEGFGSGDAGQPGRRSSNVDSCPRVTVIAPVSPADRARSGHASVEVAYYGLTSAPWSSSSPSELRIRIVFSCVARGSKCRASLRLTG